MEVSEIKVDVENNSDLKVKFEEYLSNHDTDDATKDQHDPLQLPAVKTEEFDDATEKVKLNGHPSSDEFELDPESENNSEIDSDNEFKRGDPKQTKKSSMKKKKNIPKRKKNSRETQKSLLECTLCPQSFPLVNLLVAHARIEHASMKNPTSESEPIIDDETSAQCPLCQKSLTSVSGLESHFLRYHIKNKPFQCFICFESTNEIKKFPTKGILNRHIRTVHDPSRWRYKCELCPQKFTCLFHYEEHKIVHTEKKYICEYCSKSYRKKERMLRHIIAVHKEHCDKLETLKCDFCDHLFCSNKDLEDHVLQTHVADTVQCKICFKKFLEEGELSKHLDIAHRENGIRIVCDVCSKVFKQAMDLVKHLEVEHQRFFRCKKCFMSFSTKEEFDRHSTSFRDAHGKNADEDEIHLQCNICLLFLSTDCALTIHKKSHLQQGEAEKMADLRLKSTQLDAQLKCDFCSKAFAQKFLLLEHATKCHPNQKWECESCNKSFQLKYQLVKHEMLHATSKPFKCPVCFKSFSDLSYLKKHEETHMKDKRYKCSQCEKSFALKPGLRLHIANHHGAEKPFKCNICEKSFAIKTHYNLHLFSHTEERPFGCDQCPGFFKCLKHLNNHKRKIHGVKRHRIGDRVHHGPQSKYFEHLVFVCSNEECDFESKDEKEVAIHNSKHSLPKIILSKLLPNSSPQVSASKIKPKTKRTIRTQYKCNFCSKFFGLIKSLVEHTKTVHGGQRQGTNLVIGQLHLGPRSKYIENLIFVCRVNECDFETKDEKEVAIHYAKHGLPKVYLSSEEFTLGNLHMIRARYKCKECLKTLCSPGSLRKHMRIFHGANRAKGKKSKDVVSSSDEDEL